MEAEDPNRTTEESGEYSRRDSAQASAQPSHEHSRRQSNQSGPFGSYNENDSSVNANPLRHPPRPNSAQSQQSGPPRSRQNSGAAFGGGGGSDQQEHSGSGAFGGQSSRNNFGRTGSMSGGGIAAAGNSGLRRKSTAREMAAELRRTHSMAEGMGGQSLRKRPTLASMMLSGTYGGDGKKKPGEEDEDEEEGGQQFVADDYGAFDGTEGSQQEGDKLQAEQIFMPNMKREQYIPVRIARDKVKQVLAEMSQMKAMHYSAIDTMEKQYEFLKAQLETSVATYTKKLTKDYNDRVTALEAEYRRRLETMGETAMVDLQRTLDRSKAQAAETEQRLERRLAEQDKEIETERKMVRQKIDMEQSKAQDLQQKLTAANHQIDDLTIELRVAKGDGRDSMEESSNRSLQKMLELEQEVTKLRATIAQKDDVIRQKDQDIEALQNELAEAQEQLAVGGHAAAEDGHYGQGEYGNEDYGGNYEGNNGEEGEEGAYVVGGDEGEEQQEEAA